MRFKKPAEGAVKAELQMTSMIDVVFLLLIFFMTSFKAGSQEGDFSVRMPLTGGSGSPSEQTDLPIKIRLIADAQGNLVDIKVDDSMSFGRDFSKLRGFIVDRIGPGVVPGPGEGPEIEIDLDYNIRYSNVVETITAVTGQKQGAKIVRLVERIKFAPPRRKK